MSTLENMYAIYFILRVLHLFARLWIQTSYYTKTVKYIRNNGSKATEKHIIQNNACNNDDI